MLTGNMMDFQLTINSVMRHGRSIYGKQEIISVTADQPLHSYTYEQAFARASQLGSALAEMGLSPGDRVATLAWNDYRHLEAYYGISCSGLVCHTINPRLFPEQLIYIVNHAEDKVLMVDLLLFPLVEKLRDKMPSVQRIIIMTDEAHMPSTELEVECYETLLAGRPTDFEFPEFDENTASSLCYTSGTTGDPKGVLYSHRSTVLHSMACTSSSTFALNIRDTVMPIVPMFHVNAWSLPYATVMAGCKIVFPGPKMGDGAVLTQLVNQCKVSVAAGVPTIWLAMLNHLREHNETVPSLKRICVGGAATPQTIMDEFEQQHGVSVHPAWGMTETSPLGTFNMLRPELDDLPAEQLNNYKLKPGLPAYGVELRVAGPAGNEQPRDGESFGNLGIRGPWVASQYFRSDKSIIDEQGFMDTGDIATIDQYGYMQITDRAKDVIKSGGEWISSIDLENAATSHPDIAEAAVIGVPHPKWDERPLLVAVAAANKKLSLAELNTYLGEHVAKWWLPDDVVYVDELPHAATGKLDKKVLREQFKNHQLPTA
ncbi:long-chain fatty acid--CoA ligase [Dasania sp. GY-MA-18]|uniref:Long-chain fatty acid--CoA ligase n=1 Tax=Dasania phycosphaerae TaxID=2950436 RepID=A0A9J6RKH7_9GAMM|nr:MULTISPECIES: long-chain fatty acid--CoA ligase [Dasania]MCR8922057.1 long-chain fatty acid--CoA ligase [Dasania sp. GY-MA-18]MCZ0864485.1 long-chain fatty acid--CoA ligase [Dasania phycosphaerae]MCZ0868213.1 long-chain fatty acid--CoA ligase [Dasania phycosphaerae]